MRVWPVDGSPEVGAKQIIGGADARHISSVLRLKPGDMVAVSDGTSKIFLAEIVGMGKNRVVVKIIRETPAFTLKKPLVYLAVGISKPQVMEICVQKAVELSCSGFFPLISQRSDVLSPSKMERLRKIAREAGKQCGRGDVMEVSDPVEAEGLPTDGFKIVLWEEEKGRTLKEVLNSVQTPEKIILAVGPAGGFSAEEMERLRGLGFPSAGLGRIVLRTETAAISLMAVINHHFDRM
ncbi:MAG: 16S rRNA (uracil(1498)-N(3))-methyltransferase [Nitrospinae bacterium]|nr:16S rRNA (uracil(1498)-N(3))-methyltransferase [Nitrospinota bacterium]